MCSLGRQVRPKALPRPPLGAGCGIQLVERVGRSRPPCGTYIRGTIGQVSHTWSHWQRRWRPTLTFRPKGAIATGRRVSQPQSQPRTEVPQ